jgi:hypothetical protein
MSTVTRIHPEVAVNNAMDAEQQLKLAFSPLHKRAFGVAIGVAFAAVIIVVTAVHVIVQPDGPDLGLLRYYFYGYEVSWTGALIGGFWAFVAGFVAGWFVAFCRNFVIAISVFLTRARAELQATRDFLDHI